MTTQHSTLEMSKKIVVGKGRPDMKLKKKNKITLLRAISYQVKIIPSLQYISYIWIKICFRLKRIFQKTIKNVSDD